MKKYHPETTRTQLIPFELGDLELFHSINTDAYVRKFLWDDQCIDRNTAKELLNQNEIHFNSDHWGLWKIVLKSDGSIAGYTGLWQFFEESQPQLIYALLERYAGNGLATESGRCVLEYARDILKFQFLTAATDEGHVQSGKVALRLGMTDKGTQVIDGKPTRFYRIDF